jgi:hypothetical protein
MKTMLLILMTLASVAIAGDRQMKALLVGTWTVDEDTTNTFTADGRWFISDLRLPDYPNKSEEELAFRWDIKDGALIQIREPAASRSYPILFLTKHS